MGRGEFSPALEAAVRDGCIDVSGQRIDGKQLERIIDALSGAGHVGQPGRCANFSKAHFVGSASFEDLEFACDVDFSGATFESKASFKRVTFRGSVDFSSTKFDSKADFRRARFVGDAKFRQARLGQDPSKSVVDFTRATFESEADFGEARFCSPMADFTRTVFEARVRFFGAWFSEDVTFRLARFADRARFRLATIGRVALFDLATFEGVRQLGPFVATEVVLDGALFQVPTTIDISAERIWGRNAQFTGGVAFGARFAKIDFSGAMFDGPSIVSTGLGAVWGVRGEPGDDKAGERFEDRESHLNSGDPESSGESPPGHPLAPTASPRPAVASLQGADVAKLVLSGVDLRRCLFADAHRLDGLRIERSEFETATSRSGRRIGRNAFSLPSRRETLHEESLVRRKTLDPDPQPETRGVHAERQARSPDDESRRSDAEQTAALYRALRKGRENSGDEPGAADFYYGEMEMRRLAARQKRRWSELTVLTLYWLVSGYGLRASRAFGVLTVTLLAGAVALHESGFVVDRSFARALLFACQSAISPLRPPNLGLTTAGEIVQMALRLLGPLLFGLALLALRGRVKR